MPNEYQLGIYIDCFLYDKRGYVVAQNQIGVHTEKEKKKFNNKPANTEENNHFIAFSGDDFEYTFSKDLGTFVSIKKFKEEQLVAPIKMTAWRAPTDNDKNIKRKWGWYNIWEGENLNRQFELIYDCKTSEGCVIVFGALAGVSRTPFLKYTLKYSVNVYGEIKVELEGEVKESCVWLPRLGFEFKIPYDKNRFNYFGMGPHESYCDMCRSAMVDWFESDTDSV